MFDGFYDDPSSINCFANQTFRMYKMVPRRSGTCIPFWPRVASSFHVVFLRWRRGDPEHAYHSGRESYLFYIFSCLVDGTAAIRNMHTILAARRIFWLHFLFLRWRRGDPEHAYHSGRASHLVCIFSFLDGAAAIRNMHTILAARRILVACSLAYVIVSPYDKWHPCLLIVFTI
jgi:hypothetical protein